MALPSPVLKIRNLRKRGQNIRLTEPITIIHIKNVTKDTCSLVFEDMNGIKGSSINVMKYDSISINYGQNRSEEIHLLLEHIDKIESENKWLKQQQ